MGEEVKEVWRREKGGDLLAWEINFLITCPVRGLSGEMARQQRVPHRIDADRRPTE